MGTRRKVCKLYSNDDLRAWFDLFNARYFGGRLEVARIEFTTMNLLGRTVRVRDGKRRSQHDKWWILVNRNYRGSRRIAAGTLLHECVHVEQRCMYSCGYNGHRFNRRMKELAARGALNGIW
jgi:hypothetical protein